MLSAIFKELSQSSDLKHCKVEILAVAKNITSQHMTPVISFLKKKLETFRSNQTSVLQIYF